MPKYRQGHVFFCALIWVAHSFIVRLRNDVGLSPK